MDTAFSVSTSHELLTHLADADPAQQIWHPLDMLAESRPVWRNGVASLSRDV